MAPRMVRGDGSYIGLDLGTNALKAVGLSSTLEQTHSVEVNFATDLPAFEPAVKLDSSTGTALSSPRLFLAALELAFQRLSQSGCDLGNVIGLSGSAQMHGSVYLTPEFETALFALPKMHTSALSEAECFPDACFALPDAPIWMDSSTSEECAKIESELGGPARVAAITGSRAYERFTGAQVLRRRQIHAGPMGEASRVMLISSFLASVLCGKLCPEDVGDASGTNMFEVTSVPPRWWNEGVRVCGAEGLLCEAPVEGWHAVGTVSPYFSSRFGLSDECVCCAWSGDNPNTIAAYGGLEEGDLVISLGTSDTAQWKSVKGTGAVFGHTLRSPLADSAKPEYLRMLCYSNGSRTREAVRDGRFACCDVAPRGIEKSWNEFDEAVLSVPPACGIGAMTKLGIFHMLPEIVPRTLAAPRAEVYSVSSKDKLVEDLSWKESCRLVAESRAVAIAVHAAQLDGEHFRPKRILLAGGGSVSGCLPQIIADVLAAPVYSFAGVASAAAGAARRAEHCLRVQQAGSFVPFASSNQGVLATDTRLVASPRPEFFSTYDAVKMLYSAVCKPHVPASS